MGLEENPQLLCVGSEERRCSEVPILDLEGGASFLVIPIVITVEGLKAKPGWTGLQKFNSIEETNAA